MTGPETIPVVAYFYPHDPNDANVLRHARAHGKIALTDETQLVQTAKPLFKNHPIYGSHKQPNTYCLDPEGKITSWSDADPSAIARQIELAKEYGINAFMVDAYSGIVKYEQITELEEPLIQISKQAKSSNFSFCLMSSYHRPRSVIPIPRNFEEKDHEYDLTIDSFYAMIDQAAKYWNNPNYLEINGRPALGIYGLTPWNLARFNYSFMSSYSEQIGLKLDQYSQKKYRTSPFLIAVADSPDMAIDLKNRGFDMITTYAGLADFYPSVYFRGQKKVIGPEHIEPIEKYEAQLAKAVYFWQRISDLMIHNFAPSAVVGWDASPRGERGLSIEEVRGMYPYTPLIVDSSPENFTKMLKAVFSYFSNNILIRHRLLTICAWNEITEGAALLPLLKDGKVDYGFLKALKDFKEHWDKYWWTYGVRK